MQYSKGIYAIAILASPISSVLGTLTSTNIMDDLQILDNMLDNAISDAENLNVATADLNTQVKAVTRCPLLMRLKPADTGTKQREHCQSN